MMTIDVKVAANGRMVLPKALRDAMGLHGDGKVTAILDGDGVRLVPVQQRVVRARELYRQAVKNPRTTAEFLKERVEDSDRENTRLAKDGA